MRPLVRWGSLPLLAAPVGTWALGLGDIELNSALNQPLDAEIELVSATAEELAGLSISLAAPASFERYGLDRPDFLSSLVFEVGQDSSGRNVILVSSTDSITEPFVTMLVEAQWPRGRLLREYTVFLDPPILLPEPVSAEPVTPPQARAAEPTVPAGSIPRPAASATPVAPAAAPRPATNSSASAASVDGGTYGPVQNAQTLWGIASELRPAGVSVNQMMIALYRANPEAFGGNINHLRRGAILRVPPAGELSALPAGSATAEVQRQNDAWSGQSGGSAPEPRLTLVPAGQGAADATGAGAETAAELSALRGQVADLEQQLADSERLLELRNAELAELQNQLAAAAETPADASVETPAAAADPGRELESEQLFVDEPLEAQEPAAPAADSESAAEPAQPPVATTVASEPSLLDRIFGALTSTVALVGGGLLLILAGAFVFLRRRQAEVEDATGQWDALEADLAADEEAAATFVPDTAEPAEQDFAVPPAAEVAERLDRTGNQPVPELAPEAEATPGQTGEFATADGTGEFQTFDEGTRELESLDLGAVTGTMETPQLTETGQFEGDQTLSSQTVINLDQADPIAEADFHMAYGLYDQAADLVAKALETDPGNRDYKLKLLEVFFVWGNKDSFLQTARELRGELGQAGAGDWAKVIIMGKQICPEDELFADVEAGAGDIDLDLEAGGTAVLDLDLESGGTAAELDLDLDAGGGSGDIGATTGVDLDLDAGMGTGVDLALESGGDTGLDLDLEAGETSILDLEVDGSDESSVDLDFGAMDETDFAVGDAAAAGATEGPTEGDADIPDVFADTQIDVGGEDDVLDIGEMTQAGLEAALIELPGSEDGEPAEAAGDQAQAVAAGDESPDTAGLDDSEPEDDTPTIETLGIELDDAGEPKEPTVESQTLSEEQGFEFPEIGPPPDQDQQAEVAEAGDEPVLAEAGDAGQPAAENESAIEATQRITGGLPDIENVQDQLAGIMADPGQAEMTAELDIADLGLDVGSVQNLAEEPAMRSPDVGDADDSASVSQGTGDDEKLLTATGVTQVLTEQDVESDDPGGSGDAAAASAANAVIGDEFTQTSTEVMSQVDLGVEKPTEPLDLDLADFSDALQGSDTIEQPRAADFGTGLFEVPGGATPVDLDVGVDPLASGDPTVTENLGPLDAQTMTEVGTKLDLARAYIDMGDPEGAKSILEEVLSEGDPGQRQEAQTLINALPAA